MSNDVAKSLDEVVKHNLALMESMKEGGLQYDLFYSSPRWKRSASVNEDPYCLEIEVYFCVDQHTGKINYFYFGARTPAETTRLIDRLITGNVDYFDLSQELANAEIDSLVGRLVVGRTQMDDPPHGHKIKRMLFQDNLCYIDDEDLPREPIDILHDPKENITFTDLSEVTVKNLVKSVILYNAKYQR